MTKGKQKAIIYFLYFVITIIVFIGLINLMKTIQERQIYNVLYVAVSWLLASVILGAFLALEYLIQEWHKKGKWKIRVEKIIFFIIPLFYIAINTFLPHSLSLLRFELIGSIILRLSNILPLIGVFLGYSIVTVFYKQ